MADRLGCPVTWRELECRADELDRQLTPHTDRLDEAHVQYDAFLFREAARLLRDAAQHIHDRSLQHG